MLLLSATRLRRASLHDRTRGVAAVEAALVLPVVIVLFVGIVEFGLIFKDLLAISAGVQAGARRASLEPTLERSGTFALDASSQVGGAIGGVNVSGTPVLFVYDPSDGIPDSARDTCSTRRCLTFTWSDSAKSFSFFSGSWTPCTDKSVDVGVMLAVDHQGVTRLPFVSPRLVQSAVYRFDSTAGSVCQ